MITAQHNRFGKPIGVIAAAVSVVLLLASVSLRATSVLEVSLEEMLAQSDLVFEGRAVRSVSYADPESTMVLTVVTFETLDVIKGDYPARYIELNFLGGIAGGRRLVVEGMQLPEVGEHGIYFVESLRKRTIHPFYGWSQGHLLVVTDQNGIGRVMSAQTVPMTAIDPTASKTPGKLTKGSAKGLVFDNAARSTDALTVDEFKEGLQALLEGLARP